MALVYHSRQHANKSSDLDLGIPFAAVDGLFSVLNLQDQAHGEEFGQLNDAHISRSVTEVFSTLPGSPEAFRFHQALVECNFLPGRH